MYPLPHERGPLRPGRPPYFGHGTDSVAGATIHATPAASAWTVVPERPGAVAVVRSRGPLTGEGAGAGAVSLARGESATDPDGQAVPSAGRVGCERTRRPSGAAVPGSVRAGQDRPEA